MKPDEISSSQGGKPLFKQRSILDTPTTDDTAPKNQAAAAQIFRSKIDDLFAGKNYITDESPEKIQYSNPYEKTQYENTEIKTSDWQKYHTAWQNYYQKYYEGYYTHHLRKAQQELVNEKEDITNTEFKLKQKLINKIKDSATEVRKSRHFVPILSGIIAILIFLFLQYDSIISGAVMAYVSPGHINPQNIIVDPGTNITVGPEPRIIIPKINVDAPVHYDIGNDYDSQMKAMDDGVAHFAVPGASSHPGEIGNTVLAGHSSSGLLGSGDYKFIFVQLEKLAVNDAIYANYNSKRYTYTVVRKEVVGPDDVASLIYPTTKPILTLLTCVPVGTGQSRLLVVAEQVSPDPEQATKTTPTTEANTNSSSIPGKQLTILERLFGISN